MTRSSMEGCGRMSLMNVVGGVLLEGRWKKDSNLRIRLRNGGDDRRVVA